MHIMVKKFHVTCWHRKTKKNCTTWEVKKESGLPLSNHNGLLNDIKIISKLYFFYFIKTSHALLSPSQSQVIYCSNFFHAAVNSFLKMHKKLHSTAKWNELKFLAESWVWGWFKRCVSWEIFDFMKDQIFYEDLLEIILLKINFLAIFLHLENKFHHK